VEASEAGVMGLGRKVLVSGVLLTLATQPTPAPAQQHTYSVSGAAQIRNSTGLNNPYILLARPDVQTIATEALAGPISREQLATLLRGSEVKLENLLETDVLERTADGRYKLAMTVFTVEDRELIDRVADPLARSLAAAFLQERAAFDRIFSRYDMPGVDPELVRMALIGCAILDWDGLLVTADNNYRTNLNKKANGDQYQMVLRERAPHISAQALYWGSHNQDVAGKTIFMTTFGDHHTGSKRVAFPDLTWIIDSDDMEDHVPAPVASQVANVLSAGLDEAQQIAGPIMVALRSGPADTATLAAATRQPLERVQSVLDLLTALQYVEKQETRYRAAIPVFTFERDGEMIREARTLGQDIMRRWLQSNYARAQTEFSSLSALRVGVPFKTMFTELWHPIFGWTNYHLVKQGYLHDPYGPKAKFISFVPFIWDARLRLQAFL
jgi:hypothetical protein